MARQALPIVAIVGRPNVGKSTLFNRYAGRRRALVEDVPGVTRDRIAEEVEVAGRRVLVVDTAGLDPEPRSGIDAAVQEQAQAALEDADAVLLVVDGQAGLLPQEEELARILRRTARPVAVAVNKVDAPSHAPRVAEFHRLGLGLVRGISAEHGAGAWDLLEEVVELLPPLLPGEDKAPAGEGGAPLHIALVGRPNVGKSSLLNRLCGEERAVVSDLPGTTRDSLDIRVERGDRAYVFVDTAGLRRPGRRGHGGRLAERGSALMTVRAIERAQVALVLIDAAEGFTERDQRVLALVRARGCAAALLANKWDRVEQGEEGWAERVADRIGRRLQAMGDVPLLRLSALTGRGVERIFPLARRLAAAASLQIPTAELNRWLQECVRRHEPAMAQRGGRRRPLKFFYATQTGSMPPTFLIFCSEPRAVQPSYRRFLTNQLRARFELQGVPLRLRLRARERSSRP